MPQPKPHLGLYAPQTLFGEFLFAELLHSQLYLGEFAEKIGVNSRTLVRFLEKDDAPSLDILLNIAQNLEVSFLLLVLLARPDSARLIVRQQAQKNPSLAEQRLLNSGLLPADTRDMAKSVLDKAQEDQLCDTLTVIQAITYQIALDTLTEEERAQLLAVQDRQVGRVLNSLGLGRATL